MSSEYLSTLFKDIHVFDHLRKVDITTPLNDKINILNTQVKPSENDQLIFINICSKNNEFYSYWSDISDISTA